MNTLLGIPQIIKIKATSLLLLAIIFSGAVCAQIGTYQRKIANGAYSVISFDKTGSKVNAEIFTWWNTHNGQMGYYAGTGILKNNTCTLQSVENDPDCKVTLAMIGNKLNAKFSDCATDHLTEDFNGLYIKFTNAVAGDYLVTAAKAYFYKKPNATTKLKAYVLKGDKVTLDMDRIAASKNEWLYVYFTNKAGKETSGYIKMDDLKLVK
ncbi:hypothetical protein [Mucilaginibacter aquatilis]|uniref:SH3 domain-containing protein n=1 Tax=Mucilaginibacter aquatilis TaxID=1517760 RepID=A0A6I4I958_9SPHI|nr:hypothetical protein [Mucilaginibacter aquatilis]MVN91780.1 hypothetical protein [Mucilaginibacter aquatilis]